MSAVAPKCRHCGRGMAIGEALRVTPADGRPVFHVHRPSVATECLAAAGLAPIAVADPVAADAFDRRASTPPLEAPR